MRVLFSTYPAAFDCPGGGEVMLLRSRDALVRRGVEVRLFDLWNPDLDWPDVAHYFSVQGGSMSFCGHVRRRGLPLLISPMIWITPGNRSRLPMTEINDLLHRATLALPNSEAEARQLAAEFRLPMERFAVIHNGVDPAFGEPAAPEAFRDRFDVRGPFLLNVANIEERKNQVRLARAARAISLPLVLAGNARVLVTREGCTEEYFGDLADYADPLDEAGLVRSLRAALDRPRDGRLRRHVLDHFTWDRAAGELIAAYERARLAASGHAGARP